MRTVKLKFEFKNCEDDRHKLAARIDPEQLRENLVVKGVVCLQIEVLNEIRVDLPVEDDAEFLADAYLDLMSKIAGRTKEHHSVWLGDGLLVIESLLHEGRASMTVTYSPHLDRRLSKTWQLDISVSEYVGAWTGLLRGMVELAN